MRREDPSYTLRLPADLLNEIRAEAKKNRRSMNSEMIERLELPKRLSEGMSRLQIEVAPDIPTLRDQFAMAAIPAVIAAVSAGQHQPNLRNNDTHIAFAIARDAYFMADAMLAARKGEQA